MGTVHSPRKRLRKRLRTGRGGLPIAPATVIPATAPLITGKSELKRKSLFFHYPNYAFHKRNRLAGAVVKGKHKLIRFYDDDSIELYDLKEDIGEKNNLAKSKPELAKEMRAELDQWLKESGAKMPYQPKEGK